MAQAPLPVIPPPGAAPRPTLRDYVREQAKKWDVPEDLVFGVIQQESGGTHRPAGGDVTTSSQQARGLFQLLPSTASGEFGLNADDPLQNVEAGVRYLRKGLDWSGGKRRGALAFYHGGPDTRIHGPKTRAYVEAIMAGQPPEDENAPPGEKAGPPSPPNVFDEMTKRTVGSVKNFVGEATASINPVNIYQGVKQLVTTDPRETARGMWEAHAQPVREGYYEGAIPLLGPRMVEAHQFFEQGETARGLGAMTDVLGQVLGPKALGVKGRVRVIPPILKTRLNPAEAAAVKLGQEGGVSVNAATASGSPFALKLQRAVEATPSGSPHGEINALERGVQMPRLGERLADTVHGQPVTPYQAGQRLQKGVTRFIEQRHLEADTHYDTLRSLAQRFTRRVQTGSKTDTPFMGAGGQRGTPVVTPIFEDIALPVDLRVAKQQLRPLYDQLTRQYTVTQAQASPGLKALDNLINGPDWAPAMQVDRDLGAIKTIARGADMPQLRNASQGVAAKSVDSLSAAVDQAVAQAGPRAQDALAAGRKATAKKWAAQEVFDKLNDEPVKAFDQTKLARDSGIDYLKQLKELAPQEMPHVARAVLEDLFETATAEGGWSKATGVAGRWNKLGPQTKDLLFGAQAADLDRFFLLGKMLERSPNPSGTALTLTGVGSLWAAAKNPRTGLPSLLLSGQIAKVMNRPGGVKFLTQGFTIPAAGPRAAAWTAQLLSRIGEESADGLAQPPPTPPEEQPSVTGTPPPRPPQGAR